MLEQASTTEILATIMGFELILVGAGIFFDRNVYQRLVTAFSGNIALGYLGGMLAFIVGAAIVALHNDWSGALAIAVTVVGWAALIKGALILVFPQQFLGVVGKMKLGPGFALVAGLVSILLGGALVYFAVAG